MAYQQEKIPAASALWICSHCELWWIGQATKEHQTWRLLLLAEPNSPHWHSLPPAWKLTGPDPSVCPVCGTRMSKQRLPNSEMLSPYMALHN